MTGGDDDGGLIRLDGDGEPGDATGDTRDRILDATALILIEHGFHRLSMERVADRAGVARGTIYYQFGSRAGLAEGLISSIELRERIHRSREHDRTVGALLDRVTGIWERHREVLHGILSMAAVDPQTEQVVRHHQLGRRQRIVELVDELDGAGALRVDPEDAVDLIWLLTSFSTYDFLRQDDAHDPTGARRLLDVLAAAVVDPDQPAH